MSVRATNLDDLEDIEVAGCHYRPVRRPLGITAFGTNAYSADAGEQLIEPHDEVGGGWGRREDALDHLRHAFAGEPRMRSWAADDSDLDGLRDDPAFRDLLGS